MMLTQFIMLDWMFGFQAINVWQVEQTKDRNYNLSLIKVGGLEFRFEF